MDPKDARYQRQVRLPQVGPAGQVRLGEAHVLVLGLGALGTVAAELLCRAGVGTLTLIDRDVIEPSNLHRQTLYTPVDVGHAKAAAAAARLAVISPATRLLPLPVDADADELRRCVPQANVVVDATDNAHARYLLNDVCVDVGRPWVYGGAVASEGRAAAFAPDRGGACLRCLYPQPPAPGELDTCDTVGVFGPVTAATAALQAQLTLRLLLEPGWVPDVLLWLQGWQFRLGSSRLPDAGCPTCRGSLREFLDQPPPPQVQLCGRQTVQVRPPRVARPDLAGVAARWRGLGTVRQTPYLVRLTDPAPTVPAGVEQATLFTDGRLLIEGPIASADPSAARTAYDRLVGS